MNIYGTLRRQNEPSHSNGSSLKRAFSEIERSGVSGLLFFEGNDVLWDPWTMAQGLLCATERLVPIIAVNPVYAHPFTTAKRIISLTNMYQRKIHINYVAGASIGDMHSLGNFIDHDLRYNRLDEYVQIVNLLLDRGINSTQFKGKFYQISNLGLKNKITDPNLVPEFYIGGASSAANELADKYNLTMLRMFSDSLVDDVSKLNKISAHYGLLTRETPGELEHALEKLKSDQNGDIGEPEASVTTDSIWKKQLIKTYSQSQEKGLIFFGERKSDCPYICGTYDECARKIIDLQAKGIIKHLIEIYSLQELSHICKVLDKVKLLSEKQNSIINKFNEFNF